MKSNKMQIDDIQKGGIKMIFIGIFAVVGVAVTVLAARRGYRERSMDDRAYTSNDHELDIHHRNDPPSW